MQWTLRGAHLLLQTRTKVLNDELEGVFRRWYPRPVNHGVGRADTNNRIYQLTLRVTTPELVTW